jgi:hypothetical protein
MSLFCDFCRTRVSSAASLPGHYRRKHPERVPARSGASLAALPESGVYQRAGIAADAAVKGVSDQAYVAEQSARIGTSAPVKPALPPLKKADWSWLVWAGLAVAIGLLFLSGSVTVEHDEKSDLISSYQPEGTGQ